MSSTGLVIPIVKGICGEDVLQIAWSPEKMDIPKAPGLGLFLNEVGFMLTIAAYFGNLYSAGHMYFL